VIVALALFGGYLAFVGLWSLVESCVLIVRGLPRACLWITRIADVQTFRR
jgi:hypothetical protein